MNYTRFKNGQENMVFELVWNVFNKFEAPEYPDEGIHTFKTFIEPDNLKNMLCNDGFQIYCCFDHDDLVGVLAFRGTSHISLLFVHEDYHRQGIAQNLLDYALADLRAVNKNISQLTVHSSPYARGIYEHMGFTATNEMLQQDGILFIPMVKDI